MARPSNVILQFALDMLKPMVAHFGANGVNELIDVVAIPFPEEDEPQAIPAQGEPPVPARQFNVMQQFALGTLTSLVAYYGQRKVRGLVDAVAFGMPPHPDDN
jgi:hypothetical protein